MNRGARLALALAFLALAACGKKGDPVPPPSEPKVFPRFYPSQTGATGQSAQPAASATTSDQAKPAMPGTAP